MGCAASAPAGYALELAPRVDAAVAAGLGVGGGGGAPSSGGSGGPLRGPCSMADFLMRDVIGKGGRSLGVQVAYHAASRTYQAVKFVPEVRAKQEAWAVQPSDELAAMREITQAGVPFTTPLRGWFEHAGQLALVMGYMPGGELFSRMAGRRMPPDEAAFYAGEVVLALEGIHGLGYIYRDLKPENILLDAEGHLALCDMGFAVRTERAFKRLGTPQYQAPEIVAPDVATVGYTAAVDWWALGCLLYEMMVGRAAFGTPATPPDEVTAMVRNPRGGPALPGFLPRPARELITALLARDPAARLASAAAVKAHPFFARVDWAALGARRYVAPWVPPPMRFPGDVANFDIYLRMEGETVVCRGAAARILYEKPLPKFDTVLEAVTSTTQSIIRRGASLATGLRSRSNSGAPQQPSVGSRGAGPAGGGHTALGPNTFRGARGSTEGRGSVGRGGDASQHSSLGRGGAASASAPAIVHGSGAPQRAGGDANGAAPLRELFRPPPVNGGVADSDAALASTPASASSASSGGGGSEHLPSPTPLLPGARGLSTIRESASYETLQRASSAADGSAGDDSGPSAI